MGNRTGVLFYALDMKHILANEVSSIFFGNVFN